MINKRVKVIGQEIYGKVIREHPTEVVIADEDLPTEDNELCFKKSEVEVTDDWKINTTRTLGLTSRPMENARLRYGNYISR